MRHKIAETEKSELINRYLSGETVTSIIAHVSISRSTFYAWIKTNNEEQSADKPMEINSKNFRMLENKIKRLKGMIEILQTADCTTSAPLKAKLYALEKLHGKYSVHMLCDALNVSRGTFYNHIFRNKKENTTYAARREELKLKIKELFDDYKQIFGAGKIATIMKNEGYRVSEEMVLELMREMGLASI